MMGDTCAMIDQHVKDASNKPIICFNVECMWLWLVIFNCLGICSHVLHLLVQINFLFCQTCPNKLDDIKSSPSAAACLICPYVAQTRFYLLLAPCLHHWVHALYLLWFGLERYTLFNYFTHRLVLNAHGPEVGTPSGPVSFDFFRRS